MAFQAAAKEANNTTSAQDLHVRVDGAMARVAVASFSLGLFWILVLNWVVAGWAALALSPLFLWLARQFAIAPCLDEVEMPIDKMDE